MELDIETEVCICDSQMWKPDWVIFNEGQIAAYSEKMTCILCGTRAMCPTECEDVAS